MEIHTENSTVRFEDTPELRNKVFEAILKFYLKYENYSGECILQNDDASMAAPELLADITDNIFKFEVDWKDE